jgi:hypothetical protein
MQVHQWYNFIGWETFKLRHRKRLLIGGWPLSFAHVWTTFDRFNRHSSGLWST